MSENGYTTVTLLGHEWPIILPDFGTREDLVRAWLSLSNETRKHVSVGHANRVCAAALGLCSGIGRQAKAEYRDAGFDVLAYGQAVYHYLREQGVGIEALTEGALVVLRACLAALPPREKEVADRTGFSGPAAVPSTGSP